MFKNKHVIIALIVAPILALVSYFAVDSAVSEKPHVAKEDTSYPLAEKPNCRYASGECTLVNGDVRALLKMSGSVGQSHLLNLSSTLPLDGAKISVGSGERLAVPESLKQVDNVGLEWQLQLERQPEESDQFRLVLLKGETLFYAEVGAVFLVSSTPKPER